MTEPRSFWLLHVVVGSNPTTATPTEAPTTATPTETHTTATQALLTANASSTLLPAAELREASTAPINTNTIQSLYKTVNKATGEIGGNSHGGPIYGD
jgi:hypothetical protein